MTYYRPLIEMKKDYKDVLRKGEYYVYRGEHVICDLEGTVVLIHNDPIKHLKEVCTPRLVVPSVATLYLGDGLIDNVFTCIKTRKDYKVVASVDDTCVHISDGEKTVCASRHWLSSCCAPKNSLPFWVKENTLVYYQEPGVSDRGVFKILSVKGREVGDALVFLENAVTESRVDIDLPRLIRQGQPLGTHVNFGDEGKND